MSGPVSDWGGAAALTFPHSVALAVNPCPPPATASPIKKLFFSIALLVAFTPLAQAKRVALVVGNASYVHEKKLKNPINDARLLETTFKSKPLAFDQVIFLQDASRAELLKGLATFCMGAIRCSARAARPKSRRRGLIWARCSAGQNWQSGACAGETTRLTFDAA